MSNQRLRYVPHNETFANTLILLFVILFFSFTTAIALLPWWLLYVFLQEEAWGVKGVMVIFLLFVIGIPLSILYFYRFGYTPFMEKYFPQKMQIDNFKLRDWNIQFQHKIKNFSASKRYESNNLSLYTRANMEKILKLRIQPNNEFDFYLELDKVFLHLIFDHTSIELGKKNLEYIPDIGTKKISYLVLKVKNPNEEIISAFCNSDTVTVVYKIEGYDGFEVTYDITGFKDVYDMMLNYLPEMSREDVKYDL